MLSRLNVWVRIVSDCIHSKIGQTFLPTAQALTEWLWVRLHSIQNGIVLSTVLEENMNEIEIIR